MRNTRKTLLALASLILGALGSACGGQSAAPPSGAGHGSPPPPAAQGGMPSLPAPSALLKSASTEDYQRWKNGSAYDIYNLHGNVDGGAPVKQGAAAKQASDYYFTGIDFTPSWEPGVSTTTADIALATYTFNGFDTYSGAAQLRTGWEQVDLANVWLGLANFDTERWDWFNSPADPEIDLPSFAPYTAADGRLFVVVMLLGKDTAKLKWILAGEPINPVAGLYAPDLPSNPLQRIEPLQLNFDVSGSYTLGSTITLYEIDFEGDGTYDDSSGVVEPYPHTYSHGDYTPRLRVTDNLGQTGTFEFSFHVINPANMFPTASFTPVIMTNSAPLTVNFDASASSDPDGTINLYKWDFDNDGHTDYSSSTPDAAYTFSIEGANDVKLTVVDDDLGEDTFYGQVVCSSGWRDSVLATGVAGMASSPVSAVVQGSGIIARACVAFHDMQTGSLVFVRGNTNVGTSWDMPVTIAAGSATHKEGLSPSLAIESLTQTPCIAYGEFDQIGPDSGLRFVRATNTMGTNWNMPVTVEDGTQNQERTCLRQLGGKLTIANIDAPGIQGGSTLRTFQATDSLGGAWALGTEVAISQPGEQLNSVSLLDVPGQNPLLAWSGVTNIEVAYYICPATAANASAWSAPYSLAPAPGMSAYQLCLGLAGNRPALCFGATGQGSQLYYGRADDAAGAAWTAAPANLDGADRTTGAGTPSMAVVGGKPAIAYHDTTNGNVRYISAVDAEGTAWNAPQIVDSAGNVGAGVALVCLPNNIPLVVYYDDTNLQLKGAVFF